DQTATAINELSTTVFHIAQHPADTRDQSQEADRLAGPRQQAVSRVTASIPRLSQGVHDTAHNIQNQAEDSQKITGVV
ncbi:methyl-accepting chemotaxis protein, partial [Pseudomonas aeruginosa]